MGLIVYFSKYIRQNINLCEFTNYCRIPKSREGTVSTGVSVHGGGGGTDTQVQVLSLVSGPFWGVP